MKLAISNQKGGVGKTTVALNLGVGLSSRGFKTLLIDNDPQANLTYYLLGNSQELISNVIDLYDGERTDPQTIGDNLYIYGTNTFLSMVPERGMDAVYGLKEGLKSIESDFDFIIIDCLPGLDNLLLASLTAADYVLIPIKPAPFAVSGLGDLLKTITKVQNRMNEELKILGAVFNMVDSHGLVMEREIMDQIKQSFPAIAEGAKAFQTQIYKRVKLEESTGFAKSIFNYDQNGFSSDNFNTFVTEFLSIAGVKDNGRSN